MASAVQVKRYAGLVAVLCLLGALLRGNRKWLLALRRMLGFRTLCRVAIRFQSPYILQVVREVAGRRGMVIDDVASSQVADFARIDWDKLLSGELHRVSCLYNRANLVRKGMLSHYLAKYQKKKQTPLNILPEGFDIDLEDESDIEMLKRRLLKLTAPTSDGPAWVAKASVANRGEHLYIANTVEEIVEKVRPAALNEGIVEWVVQRYIAHPVLIHGRKFHIRAHFLVSGCSACGTSRAWLHNQHHVLLLASEVYRSKGSSAESDRFAHMTNHCINVTHPDYEEQTQILAFQELDAAMGRSGAAAAVLARMEEALEHTLAATSAARTGFFPLPHCFELFGADFMLEDRGDEAPGVWLLEVNAGPDLGVFGERLRGGCISLMEDVVRCAVEPHVAQQPAFSEAGHFVKSKHEESGIAVRGPQSEV